VRWCVLILLTLSSCGPTIRPDFNSPEPAARNQAIIKAAEHSDQSAVPDLVRMLDSDDPATRLLAINALERITGDRRGYDPAAPESERRKATDNWQRYVEEHYPKTSALPCSPAPVSPSSIILSPPHPLTSSGGAT
jgi:HEAT repeat protein